jgi:NADH-quinone oxidoreductase subunit L
MAEKALLGIVLFPLLGALAIGVFGRRAGRSAVQSIGVLSVAASFVLALLAFGELLRLRWVEHKELASLSFTAYEWFSLAWNQHQLNIPVRFVMDALSGVMTLIITGIGLLIHIYSTGYMSEEPSYGRFFAYLNLFTASMLILVLGSNLPLMFVGWEGVGLCSYLLIGFWFENPSYAAAGRKAFVANRIGDLGVLLGMFLLAVATNSLEFSGINAVAEARPSVFTAAFSLGPRVMPYWVLPGISFGTVATLLLFLGCSGKSAQLPLYVWLPDAMAGPTPVSALIHAATMVTAGVYMICRLSPVFALAPVTMAVIATLGALTALLGASVGLVQNQLKKILAYSTVSQLGFMFAAVGCGAFAAGFMHVYTHAFFKACLFLGAGSVMHAVGAHGDADIRKLGGLRRFMPVTRATFLVSCWAITGVPLVSSGLFSKDEILVGVLSAQPYFSFAPWLAPCIFGALVLAAVMTSFYMFRLYFLTFSGEYRGAAAADHHDDDHHHAGTPHESPTAMTIPLVVLGLGAVFAGYVWVGIVHFDPWVRWLAPALGSIGVEHPHNAAAISMACGLAATALGIGLAAQFYYRGSDVPARLAAQFKGLHQLLLDEWRVDKLYDVTILAASRLVARASNLFDVYVIDVLTTVVPTQIVRALSFLFTRMQTGLVHAYGAVMAFGLLALVAHFVVPHGDPELVGDPEGMKAQLAASAGLGYEYRWDFDSDGQFDTAWSAERSATRDFTDADFVRFAVVFEGAAYGSHPRTMTLAPKDSLTVSGSALGRVLTSAEISADEFGPSWQQGDDNRLPLITSDHEGLLITPRGARVRKAGTPQAPDKQVRVARGESVNIGFARLTVSGYARPRVQVRNVFGIERTQSVGVVVPKVARRVTAQVAAAHAGVP